MAESSVPSATPPVLGGAFTRAAADFLTNRIPLWLTMWWSMLMIGGDDRKAFGGSFLGGWFRWDSFYYQHIAEYGYTNVPNAFGQRDTHFWPFFPFLWKLLARVTPGHDFYLAAFVLNGALLFGSVVLFQDVARRAVGEGPARLASWLLLAYPFAFYYSAAYTEASFLFFSLLALHFGQRRRWLVAGLAAACASATRAAGISTTIALFVLYLEECDFSWRKIRLDVLCVALGAVGALEYVALLWVEFRDPQAFMSGMHAKDWGADVTWARFFDRVDALVHPGTRWPLSWIEATDLFHVGCLAFAFVATLWGARRLRPHLTVFAAVGLLIGCRLWTNGGRYAAPLFPVYIAAAAFLDGRPAWTRLVVTGFLLAQALFAIMFGHGYWVS